MLLRGLLEPGWPRFLTQPSLFGNYVPRSHHEGAAYINLRSRTKNLLIQRQAHEPLRHQGRLGYLEHGETRESGRDSILETPDFKFGLVTPEWGLSCDCRCAVAGC